MPLVQGFPTWKNMNSVNSTSASGQTDNMTGAAYYGDGLYPGIYADMTNAEAAASSNLGVGLLYNGRYRYVQVDSGATAANVKTGTVGYMRSGSTVDSVVLLTAGSGQTAGTYQVAATVGSGGGSGAIIQVIVGSAGTVTSVSVVNGGFGYVSVPTFTLVTGGTVGTVAAELHSTPNIVTSADQVSATAVPVHPVVFLSSITPGNYGFIQELGLATVLGNVTQTSALVGSYVNAVTSNSGTVTTTAASGSPIGSTIGLAVDLPVSSNLFKVQLGYAAMVIQD